MSSEGEALCDAGGCRGIDRPRLYDDVDIILPQIDCSDSARLRSRDDGWGAAMMLMQYQVNPCDTRSRQGITVKNEQPIRAAAHANNGRRHGNVTHYNQLFLCPSFPLDVSTGL